MLSGSVGDYDAAAQTAIKTVLAREADVSTSAVRLTLAAGSVIVNADIFFGSQTGATFGASQLSTGVLADTSSLETAVNAQFAADGLGITTTVQSLLAAPQAVVGDVAMPSPPPPSPPPPSPPPPGILAVVSAEATGDDPTAIGSAEATGGGSSMVVVGAGAGGGVALLLVILIILYCRRKPTKQSSAKVRPIESVAAKPAGMATPGVSSSSRSSRSNGNGADGARGE